MPNDKTLRDEFAMAALTGLITLAPYISHPNRLVRDAYDIADAMMKERSQEGGNGRNT